MGIEANRLGEQWESISMPALSISLYLNYGDLRKFLLGEIPRQVKVRNLIQ